LRAGFLEIQRNDPQRCKLIDASRDIESVAADVWAAVSGAG
jgi:thymidylate kinase